MELSLDLLKEICQLFAENFPGKIKMYIFGSSARKIKEEIEKPEEEKCILDGAFEKDPDIDFLFEIESKKFFQYAVECGNQSVDFFSGKPFDPMDYYWEYHSSKKIRFMAATKILQIDNILMKKITEDLDGSAIDLLLLPFNWRKRKDVLKVINYQDPNFTENISQDAILIFEK
ncbi:MAG: hypothetical protein Q7T79_01565 [bacterium]|nr:hypothetical protein [bacterium]